MTDNISEQDEPNWTPQGVTKITEWLFLGGEDDVHEIINEIDIWIDFRDFSKWNRVIYVPEEVIYVRIPFKDGDNKKVKSALNIAKNIIDQNKNKYKILISCHAGFSRSALLATWVLAEETGDLDVAFREIKSKRPYVEFHENFSCFVQELRNKYSYKK